MKEHSAIYECQILHHRLMPKVHRFSYNVFYLWLDLDELETWSKRLRLFKRNRFSLFSFFDRDHLDKGHKTTKENVLQLLVEKGVDVSPIRNIRLLTFPRVLGYIFNPVCFYYCFGENGEPLYAVAEVTNTYHEQKPYVVCKLDKQDRFRLETPKHFYVSPFLDMELYFDFKLHVPAENLNIQIDDRDDDERVLLTSLKGKRRPLTDASLLACAVKYPLLTLKVIFSIHWQAFLLWIKKLPVYAKADRPDLQRDVYRPHHSIAPPKP